MAFIEIETGTPVGTDRGKVLDENIRTFKSAVAANLAAISGYPNLVALITAVWTTATRPTENLVAGMFGYNTTLHLLEYWTGSAWAPMGMAEHTHPGDQVTSAVANATNAVTATTANNIPTADVGGNIWIA